MRKRSRCAGRQHPKAMPGQGRRRLERCVAGAAHVPPVQRYLRSAACYRGKLLDHHRSKKALKAEIKAQLELVATRRQVVGGGVRQVCQGKRGRPVSSGKVRVPWVFDLEHPAFYAEEGRQHPVSQEALNAATYSPRLDRARSRQPRPPRPARYSGMPDPSS